MSTIRFHDGGVPLARRLGQLLALTLFGLIFAAALAIVILPRTVWQPNHVIDVRAVSALTSGN